MASSMGTLVNNDLTLKLTSFLHLSLMGRILSIMSVVLVRWHPLLELRVAERGIASLLARR